MIVETAFNPGWLPLAAAFLVPLLSASARSLLLLATPLAVLVLVWTTAAAPGGGEFLGLQLHPYAPGDFGRFFATVFAMALFANNLFALRQASVFELSAASFYAGSAIYITLCGDFLSLVIFWELMMLGSSGVIFAAATAASRQAGMRYLLVHGLSGVLLLTGILGMIAATGDTSMRALPLEQWHHWLILCGLLINAGAPPLSAWIADAYPEASPSGSVYLSAFTTKTAVFALITVFPGEAILVPVGLYMIFYGIVYALGENDMRRILCYSIVNQVGFMVTGIGIGTAMALNGAALHAFTHIIYKALLLMSAGSVLLMTQRRQCSQLGGLYHSMRLTTLCGIIGALSISAFPLTSGFVSKPLIEEAAVDAHLLWLWLLLLIGSAGVFLHAGIKFPWFVFFQKDSGLRPADPPANMRIAMSLLAALCLFIGIFPAVLYAIAPVAIDYAPYTAAHLVTKLQLLLFAGAAFFVWLPWLQRKKVITLDVDWLYRRALPQATRWMLTHLVAMTTKLSRHIVPQAVQWTRAKLRPRPAQDPDPMFAEGVQSAAMVVRLAVVLAVLLYVFYRA